MTTRVSVAGRPIQQQFPTGRRLRRPVGLLVVLALLLLAVAGWDGIRPLVRRALVAEPVPAAMAGPIRATSESQPAPAVRPEQLFIPSLGVNAPVVGMGAVTKVDAFTGSRVSTFGVPPDVYSTAWWADGPRPGAADMAVILGHAAVGGYGVFEGLPTVPIGSVVGITGHGALLRYVVTEVRTGLPKSDPEALVAALTNPPPGTGLALVTCSGDVDPSRRSHEDNTVVFARLADWTTV